MVGDTNLPSWLVVDASVVLNFLMPDENTPETIDHLFDNIRLQKTKAVAPEILNYEVANALRSAILSKRVDSKVAFHIYRDFSNIGIEIKEIDCLKVLESADKKNLSVYDASYVYLSKKLGIPLLTTDENLSKATDKKLRFEVSVKNKR